MNIILFDSHQINRPLARSDKRAQHLLSVLKSKEGDTIRIGVINGPAGLARITAIDSLAITIQPDHTMQQSLARNWHPNPLAPISVMVGIPRPPVVYRVLRDLASIGVADIVLCGTSLTEKSYLQSRCLTPTAIRGALIDGAAQAGTTTLPTWNIYPSVSQALANHYHSSVAEKLLLVSAGEAAPLSLVTNNLMTHLHRVPRSVQPNVQPNTHINIDSHQKYALIMAVGPERGWIPAELTQFLSHNFVPVQLGPRILRTETVASAAALMAASVIGASSKNTQKTS